MVSADMCKHDWPGTSCPECRQEEQKRKATIVNPPSPAPVPPGSVWEYKNAYYRVIGMDPALSQDPDIGEWRPTVRYELEKPGEKMEFLRTITELTRKFRRVS